MRPAVGLRSSAIWSAAAASSRRSDHHVDQRHLAMRVAPRADRARRPCASVRAPRRSRPRIRASPAAAVSAWASPGASASARRNDASAAAQSQSWPCCTEPSSRCASARSGASSSARCAASRARSKPSSIGAKPIPRLHLVDPRQPRPRQREIRVERKRLPEQRDRPVGVRLRRALAEELSLQVELEGLGVVAAPGGGLAHLGRRRAWRRGFGRRAQQCRAQLLDHRLRDVVLHGEDVVELAVVGLRPQVRVRRRP